MKHMATHNEVYHAAAYPLKDSSFGKDISSERSKQIICHKREELTVKMTFFFSCDSSKIRNAKRTHHFLWAVYTGHSELILCR